MISRSNRLRTREVVAVLKKGRALPSGTYLSAKFLPAGEGATIRSAAVVSKKVAKTAVIRNRIRRAVYDAIHAANGTGAHVVFFVRSLPARSLRQAFTRDINTILAALPH